MEKPSLIKLILHNKQQHFTLSEPTIKRADYAPFSSDVWVHIFSFLNLPELLKLESVNLASYFSLWGKNGTVLCHIQQRKTELVKGDKNSNNFRFILSKLIFLRNDFDKLAKTIVNKLFGDLTFYFDKNISQRIRLGEYDAKELISVLELLRKDTANEGFINEMISSNKGKYMIRLWEKQKSPDQLKVFIAYLKNQKLNINFSEPEEYLFYKITKEYAKLGNKREVRYFAKFTGSRLPETYFKCAKIFAKRGDSLTAYDFLVKMEHSTDPYAKDDIMDIKGCRIQIETLLQQAK
ncbi:MAG: hypothetical protein COZ46_06320 [Verrucomicrobia bacterium CG_4_10_14_3_um_filter_43_23]|nr:MAG: hypothetical protein AUJ82_08035 [Verrucomicrobia bacterium CG1_02_43_26]PIP59979.1 MAG: hypothetical protein COX01_01125 [Verrucomicrobia bacterium CG22_combo_CG10-13_8_21_14_all_43_17]PIX58008.1 MAG: hypothetical protein COZ46_06320 [Verrucomicrobia bacterium CG_4_10_14_3_um_filter_43_23]PIY61890.1 MAG: hypothetical protein COY94_03560 [Verrucomicrobia bacterium CG_4_10_14_0_8_um_filter_43_34]PJA43972.1 MAG: hypothetical protein CO175_05335 [Verrucomicrobia bacterium CG_4_9_14_3_um_fi